MMMMMVVTMMYDDDGDGDDMGCLVGEWMGCLDQCLEWMSEHPMERCWVG